MGIRIPLEKGKKYGNFVVIEYRGKQIFGKTERNVWLVECMCGEQVIAQEFEVRKEKKKSCGCLDARLSREPFEINQKIGNLTVIGYLGKRVVSNRLRHIWEVQCNCGTKIEMEENLLKRGTKKSCGCLTRIRDLTGKTVGKLTVLSFSHTVPKKNNKGLYKYWKVICECGTEKSVEQGSLTRKLIKSCGCIMAKNAKKRAQERDRIGMLKERLYKEYIKSANKREYSFSLTKEEFVEIIEKACFYCGTINSNIATDYSLRETYSYNGIDRLNNDKGYEKDNVVSCCKVCNAAKSNLTKDDFLAHILAVYKHCIQI